MANGNQLQQPVQTSQPATQNQIQTQPKSKKWLWIIIILVLIALGIGAYFLFFNPGGQPPALPQTP